MEEGVEEDLGVGDGAAGCSVSGYGADVFEAQPRTQDELDGTHLVEARNGASGDDGEVFREGGDGDEAEIGTVGEKVGRALGG